MHFPEWLRLPSVPAQLAVVAVAEELLVEQEREVELPEAQALPPIGRRSVRSFRNVACTHN